MLFRRLFLEALYNEITDQHGTVWQDALLRLLTQPATEVGSMSELDLYGQFVSRTFSDAAVLRWYSNIKVSADEFSGAVPIPRWKRRFRFVSNHQRV